MTINDARDRTRYQHGFVFQQGLVNYKPKPHQRLMTVRGIVESKNYGYPFLARSSWPVRLRERAYPMSV